MYLKSENKKELLEILEHLISYKTIYEKDSNYPFGLENKKCLDYVLSIGEKLGFKTKNLDNYCGFMEIGKGNKTIGIVCHLDVVPAGENWDTNPFELTKKGNKLYGRGATDDKGPLAASIIALKIINDLGINLTKKIRLIVGCNEETGCKCMKYYKTKEKDFDYGFTPDADFPLIHGEKGILEFNLLTKTTNIIDIEGGTAFNKIAGTAKIKIPANSYDKEILKNYLTENGLTLKINTNNDIDTVIVEGKEGHASTPNLGKNAISYLLTGLKKANFEDEFIDFFNTYLNTSCNGEELGLNLKDDYSNLTLNIGKIKKENNLLKTSIDIRFPVTFKSTEIIKKLNNKLQSEETELELIEVMEPLFYDPNTKLITKLYEAYQEISHDKESKPLVIGGGTYAKTLNNCVGFGPCFPNENNNIHNANEFIEINRLYDLVEYYVVAILKLLEI